MYDDQKIFFILALTVDHQRWTIIIWTIKIRIVWVWWPGVDGQLFWAANIWIVDIWIVLDSKVKRLDIYYPCNHILHDKLTSNHRARPVVRTSCLNTFVMLNYRTVVWKFTIVLIRIIKYHKPGKCAQKVCFKTVWSALAV